MLKLKNKPLTDKQLKYIYNMILIPRIEYRTRLTVLSHNECDTLFSKAQTFIKHKLRFPKSSPNSILTSSLFYGFNDLFDIMIQSKLQHFAIMINGDTRHFLLSLTSMIRLKQLQEFYWLPDDPLACWPAQLNNVRHDNFIGNVISLYLKRSFSFHRLSHPMDYFKIQGGDTPLLSI